MQWNQKLRRTGTEIRNSNALHPQDRKYQCAGIKKKEIQVPGIELTPVPKRPSSERFRYPGNVQGFQASVCYVQQWRKFSQSLHTGICIKTYMGKYIQSQTDKCIHISVHILILLHRIIYLYTHIHLYPYCLLGLGLYFSPGLCPLFLAAPSRAEGLHPGRGSREESIGVLVSLCRHGRPPHHHP